jgi:hypothetical protein
MPNHSAKALLLALIVLFPLSIYRWHAIDTRPSSWDETRHMKLAMDYGDWLKKGVPLTDPWSHVYPPMYHLSLLVPLSFGVPSEAKAAIANIGYVLILIWACILLGRSAGRPDWESVFAAFLCCGYCYVLWASRRALIDFPLMCWVTFSMAMLARARGFSDRARSFQWAVVAGLGLLLKAPFVFFSVGPVLWVLARSKQPEKWKNFLMAGALCGLICIPWYFWQSAYFIQKASSLAVEPQGPGTDPHTLAGWLIYGRWFREQMGLPSLCFSVIGIALAFVRKPRDGNGILVAWALSGYLLLSMLINKDLRHTLPILPALAILAARGWGKLVGHWRGGILIALAGPVLLLWNVSSYDRPAQENWHHADILSLLAQRHDASQPLLEASVLSHQEWFFARTLKWTAMQKGTELDLTSPGDSDTSFVEYIIRRPGFQGTETELLDRKWQDLRPESRAFTQLFSLVGQYTLPDHSVALVYERHPHPQFQVAPLNTKELERRIALALHHWVQGDVKVVVEATPAELKEGRLRRVQVTCAPCTYQGARIEKAEVVVEKPWLNLYRLWDENRLGLMAFESLKPTLQVTAADALSKLSAVKGLTNLDVQMVAGKLIVRGHYKGISVAAIAHVSVDNSRYAHLDAILDRISVAGIPLPGWILGKAHHQSLWLYPIPDFPGHILVDQVQIENNAILIS